ncbi:MAG: histidine kinase [Treponema sp.]|jgi:signal transduction histidine kinase|nr:histidine kinase [Treponema sp.]
MKEFHRSFSAQIFLSILGSFVLLVLSTAYIVFSSQKLQEFSRQIFEQERFIKSVQADLAAFEGPLMEFLSSRSSNALSQVFIDTQEIRQKLPVYRLIKGSPEDLKEREIYALVFRYLNLAEEAIEEKRGRNIPAYTALYEELAKLKDYINREIDAVSTARYRSQMNAYEDFLAQSGTVQLWNFIFIISMSVFSMLLLLHSLDRFTNPLIKLSAMTREISSGNFSVPDMETGRSSVEELDQVIEAFNHMKGEISKYIEEIRWQENIKQEYMREKMRNMKMEGLVRHMEIYALQAQMNPHFLFNTINTGMQLAIVEGADRTGEYMDYMARLFRHIIRNKEIIVPLRHEIQGLEYYFYILRVRFPRNMELTMDCGEELLDLRTPVSILQPLVENCVIHAFKDVDEAFVRRIGVRARLEGARLSVTVRDNGRGMEPERAARLLHPQSIDESSVSRVMGLENVIQRLYFFYPDDPGVVNIQTGPEGTAVIIRVDTEREPCLAF